MSLAPTSQGQPLEAITGYLSEHLFRGEAVAPDQDLIYSGALDSLSVMRLVAFIEEQFAIAIPPQDITITMVETPRAVAQYVEARCEAAA